MEEQNDLMEVINALREEVSALREEHNKLSKLVYEDIVAPVEDEYNKQQYDKSLNMWKDRYGDRLSPYSDKFKAIEGDDFDIVKQSFDDWNESDYDSDEWVEALIQSIDEQLAPLSKVFGVPQEDLNATVEIENGEVTDIKADTEPEVGEEPSEEEVEVEDTDEEEVPELSEEEQFQKELDEAFEKQKRM